METEVSGLDLQTWFEENAPPPPVGKDELTPQIAGDAWGIDRRTARKRLLELVDEGKLEQVMRRHPNGLISPAYVIVDAE